jgi:Ni/Fe-hydrogenase subunit HybB-like protein
MLYSMMAWIDLAPAFLERARTSTSAALRRLAESGLPALRKALPWMIAFSILLPTMHQSSLGSLLLLSGPRLHPLWNTPLLPLLFLVSCISMGYSAVVIESSLSSSFLGRKPETAMLAGLGGVVMPLIGLYLALRVGDLVVRAQLGALFTLDLYGIASLIELGLFVAAMSMLATDGQRRHAGNLFRASLLLLLAGALYRFDVFLVAFQPGAHWSYFPNVNEILITTGLVAGEIAGYIVLVKLFPILAGGPQAAPAH